jgi:hypothetical protein
MSERATAFGLLALCGAYLGWVAWSALLALDPQVTSQGLYRTLPPPRVTQHQGRDVTLLDARPGTLVGELARRYHLPHADVRLALAQRRPLESLSALLSARGETVKRAPLRLDSALPSLVWITEGTQSGLHLLIGRYAGGWVRYEPTLGALMGPIETEWLGAPSLTSSALRERRW